MTPDQETAWLAGLLEGEGYFGARTRRKTGRGRPTLEVKLEMTDLDVVRRAHRVMNLSTTIGTYVRPEVGHEQRYSPSYISACAGVQAERIMRLVRPYMGQRRGAEIDRCLSLNLSHHPREVLHDRV